jgi:hypothetical protein
VLVCLRWWANPAYPKNKNKLISRTTGKITFVDNKHTGPQPGDGEFWLSSITTEVFPGQLRGCFLAEPFLKVEFDDLLFLNKGNCTVSYVEDGSVAIIDPALVTTPDGQHIPWMLPLPFRKELRTEKVIATVVNLGGDSWTTVGSD